MNAHPNSNHSLDDSRFYQFVKTVMVYRSKKWQNYVYFETAILGHPTYFDSEKIPLYWERLKICAQFYAVKQIPTVSGDSNGKHDVRQVGVLRQSIYDVPISRREFLDGGITNDDIIARKGKLT